MSALTDSSYLISSICVEAIGAALLVHRETRALAKPSATLDQPSLLPTVSVLVPARNETHALEDHLTALLQSTYQKLEIIVLDDCSTDDTPSVIKAYAHDGVRFIEGEPVPENWIGRNFACEQLRKQASGEYLIFIDVDTRIKPDTISRLIAQIISSRSPILGVMPRPSGEYFWSEALSPLRHFYTLLDRIPATTAITVVEADWLESIGGFERVSALTVPEQAFFKEASNANTGTFQIATSELGVTADKKWRSSVDRSIRTYAPELGTVRSIFAALVLLIHASIPVALLLIGLLADTSSLFIVAASYFILLQAVPILVYSRIAGISGSLLRALFAPLLLLQEVVLIIISAVGYARGVISWKERNICLPRIHFVSKYHR